MTNRRLISLCESISDDYLLNQEIEEALADFRRDLRVIILDALEVIMTSGSKGISEQEIQLHLASLYPEMPSSIFEHVTQLMPLAFPFCVSSEGTLLKWSRTKEEPVRDDPEFSAAVNQQVHLTDSILGLMKRLGTFTKAAVVAHLSQQMQIPPETAAMLVTHTMDTLNSAIMPVQGSQDTYRYVETKAKTKADHMAFLRSLAGGSGPKHNV